MPCPAAQRALPSCILVGCLTLLVTGCISAPARRAVGPDAAARLQEGEAHLAVGNSAAARECFQVLESPIQPASVRGEASIGLGRCELNDGNWQLGIEHLKRAQLLLDAGTRNATISTLLAEAHLELGNYELVRVHLGRAFPYMSDGPRRQASAYLLSLLYEREARTDRAERYLALAGNTQRPEFKEWRRLIVPETTVREVRRQGKLRKSPSSGNVHVFTRSQWKAGSTLSNVVPMGAARRITIHHTGEEQHVSPGTSSECAEYLRRLQRHAQRQRGMGDIPYHYLIDARGNVYEGRPLRYQGAHAGNKRANKNNIGIALIGNFEKVQPARAQLWSLASLLTHLQRRYRIPTSRVYSHQQLRGIEGLAYTACPGTHLARALEGMLRRSTAASASIGGRSRTGPRPESQ